MQSTSLSAFFSFTELRKCVFYFWLLKSVMSSKMYLYHFTGDFFLQLRLLFLYFLRKLSFKWAFLGHTLFCHNLSVILWATMILRGFRSDFT